MTCGVTVIKYRGRGLLMFLEPFCKISGRFSNVFFITPMFTAFISIYDSTLVCDRILVLGSHKEASDGLSSFKEHLNPKFVAHSLYSLTKSLIVWDYHVQVCFVVLANGNNIRHGQAKLSCNKWRWYHTTWHNICPNNTLTSM